MSMLSLRRHYTNKSQLQGYLTVLKFTVTVCHTAEHCGEEYDDWNSAVLRSRRNWYIDERVSSDSTLHIDCTVLCSMVLRGTLVSMANMRWLEAVFCRLYTTVEADQDIDQPLWRLRPGPPVVQSLWNVLFCIPVCRLELAEVGAAEQVGPNACQHESLEDLGHGWQVGDRLVVRWLISMFGEF